MYLQGDKQPTKDNFLKVRDKTNSLPSSFVDKLGRVGGLGHASARQAVVFSMDI